MSYNVADSKDAVTVSVRIEDETGDVIADADIENIAELQPTHFGNGGKVSVLDWLSEENRNGFLINVGYSAAAADPVKVNVSNAWTATDAADFAPPAPEEEDPHDPNDLAPRQGDGALRVYYEQGPFTEILARFDRSSLSGLPEGLEADIWSGDVTAFKAQVDVAQTYSEDLETQAAALRASYADLSETVQANEKVVAALTQLGEADTKIASLKTVHEQHVAEAAQLVEEIGALGAITAESKEMLEDLYSRYNDLPEAYRAEVTNYTALQTAIGTYLTAISQPNENGESTVLHFDELLGQTQVGSVNGGTSSYTTEVKYGDEAGSLEVAFEGTMPWAEVNLQDISCATADEIHLWVYNGTENRYIVAVNWVTGSVYSPEGSFLSEGAVIPANCGWVEVVITQPTVTTVNQLNITSIDAEGGAIDTVGTLYIGRMVFVNNSSRIESLLKVLVDKEANAYTAADIAAIKEARSVYNSLSPEEQSAVDASLVQTLEACEADIATYYTLSDLTETTNGYYGANNLATGNAVTIDSWAYGAANLPSFADTLSATVVFKASGLAAGTDGAMYISLFHDGSANAGQSGDGLAIWLRTQNSTLLPQNSTNQGVAISEAIATAQTYTFYIGYSIASDYSSLTLTIRMENAGGTTIASDTQTVTSVSFSDFGNQTNAQWLRDDANAANHQTFYINGGASTSVTVSDAG